MFGSQMEVFPRNTGLEKECENNFIVRQLYSNYLLFAVIYLGGAMFQAVSPSVRSYVRGCGTCGGETGKRTRLSGVLCIFPPSIIPPMHHTLDSSICHWPYEILATDSFIKHNTSLFTEHIHGKPCIKRSDNLINTSTPTLRYVLF